MPTVTANNIEIAYEDHGDPKHPAILLIMGFGAQLTLWPDEFVEALAAEGFRVIRYDNRDIGLSQKFTGQRAPGLIKMTIMSKLGLKPRVPYTLSDMADDGVGLLDALGIDKAHIVGASMGGMIAQLVAINHPQRTQSLTSIFSTTGSSKVPAADTDKIKALITRPANDDEDTLVAHGMMLARTIGSPDYPADEDRLRERVTMTIRRSFYPEGPTRHMSAIMSDGDRTTRLASVTAPTLVLHGEADGLVKPEGGHATAAAIKGATIKTYPGWGHDLPPQLMDSLVADIVGHLKRA